MAQPGSEILVCDTSFVATAFQGRAKPEVISHWPAETIERIDSGLRAISVVTEAEIRAGWISASWGDRRIADARRALDSYIRFPMDQDILERWAHLSAARKSRGRSGISDNDLWIAATAIERGCPLVSCDRDHGRDMPLLASALEVIYLPRSPSGLGT